MKIATNQICTLWKKLSTSKDGSPVYDEPVEFICRFEDRNQKFQEHAGDERISTSIIYTQDSEILSIGDLVALGSLGSGPTSPTRTTLSVRVVRAKNMQTSIGGTEKLIKLYCQ